MSRRPRKVDIRAHYAAPSKNSDDTRYTAHAAAYLAFQPTRLSRMADLGPRLRQPDEQRTPRSPQPIAPTTSPGLPTYLDETQAAVLVLQSQLSGYTDYRVSSPPVTAPVRLNKRRAATSSPSSSFRDIGCSDDSRRSLSITSSHLVTPVFERSVKRRRTDDLEAKPIRTIDGRGEKALRQPQEQNSRRLQAIHDAPSELFAADMMNTAPNRLERPHVSDETTSELPTTYSLTDVSSDRSKVTPHSLQRSVSDPGPATEAHMAQSAESHSSRSHDTTHNLAKDQLLADKSTESESQQQQHHAHDQQPSSANNSDLSESSTQSVRHIQPPAAPVTIGTFRTHITARLQYLADSPKLERTYNPSQIGRLLDTSERGHWVFSIESWSQTLRKSFWTFMDNFISSGASGWGIWCTWTARISPDQQHIVKAFCWGEIVEHTYLLLYVASRSHIRKLKLDWIDAEGEIVVSVGNEHIHDRMGSESNA